MSTAVVPEAPNDVTEPVDSPEVVREKADVERTSILLAKCQKKVRAFNRQLIALQAEIDGPPSSGLVHAFKVMSGKVRDAVAERTRLRKRYLPIIFAAEQLARYASGLIENARLPQLDKIELQFRNAELEAELIEARHLIG